jgi:hypothetical protein
MTHRPLEEPRLEIPESEIGLNRWKRLRCAECGREGSRGFTTRERWVVVCANEHACELRSEKPVGLPVSSAEGGDDA